MPGPGKLPTPWQVTVILWQQKEAPEIYIIIEHLIEENSLLKTQQSYDDINVSSFDEEILDEHIRRKNEEYLNEDYY